MRDCSNMSISADGPSDETSNRDPLALLLRINIVQFFKNSIIKIDVDKISYLGLDILRSSYMSCYTKIETYEIRK